jgi:hypothetical protein
MKHLKYTFKISETFETVALETHESERRQRQGGTRERSNG